MKSYITYTVDLTECIGYYMWSGQVKGSTSFYIEGSEITTYTQLDVLLAIF